VKKYLFRDYLLIGTIMLLGLAEVLHVAAVFLGWPISRCSKLFAAGVLVLLVAGFAFCVYRSRKQEMESVSGKCPWTYVLLALLVLSQIVFICLGNESFRDGDMTVETVGSFLLHDGAYKVNPMTGNPYTGGIPLRLEILGLPTLYSMICDLTGMAPVFVVQKLVPVCVLLLSYVAFGSLGNVLFADDTRKKGMFLTMVSLLIWVGAYMYGMDGFNLLCCGWRGVTIRNLVLLPWLFSLCIRGNKFGILLCFAAEACMVWTLYGLGVCVPVVAGMLLASVLVKKFGRPETEEQEKEESI